MLFEQWDGHAWIDRSGNGHVPIDQSNRYAGVLDGVAGTSAHDIWTVGTMGGSDQLLAQHFNGRRWTVYSPPFSSPVEAAYPDGTLTSVAVITGDDVWAVGYTGAQAIPIAEHWNGQQWRLFYMPDPSTATYGGASLAGVIALSRRDVWAVGSYIKVWKRVTLIEHWDGAQWRIVPSPNATSITVAGDDELNGISAASAHDIWTVGYSSNRPLIEHWNGKSWRVVREPEPVFRGCVQERLSGIVALTAHDAWAVGVADSSYYLYGPGRPLIYHWNGVTWQLVPSPNVAGGIILLGVAAVSANNVWAFGTTTAESTLGLSEQYAVVEHWNGVDWRILPA